MLAPLFTVIKQPSAESKLIGAEKKKSAHQNTLKYKFWEQFIGKINEKSSICQNITPGKSSWLSVALGMSGISMYLVITNTNARSEIYIDRGNNDENKKIYDLFFAKKEQIENDFKGELTWKRLDDRRASKIESQRAKVNISKEEDWGKITEFLIDSAIRMHAVFIKHIPEIRAQL